MPVRFEELALNTGAIRVLAGGELAQPGRQRLALALDHQVALRTELHVAVDLPTGAAIRGAALTYEPPPSRRFAPITPRRRFDSRTLSSNPLASGTDIAVNYDANVPARAIAVVMNVTLTGTTGAGWVAVYPEDGDGFPGVSTVNWWAPGQTIANSTSVGLVEAPRVRLRVQGGSAHVIIDDIGFHLAS